jgi:hypothetical protein
VTRKVAIVGGAGTNVLAPFRQEDWEIWGLPWISYPRVTRFFEIHEEAFYTGPDEQRDGVVAENAEKWPDVPVYCTASRAHAFKNPVLYPLEELKQSIPTLFLEDSVAHMIALAIHEKVDEIGLYGVHMMGAYASHRPSVTYLVGVAEGRGIKVHVAPGSPLFMSLYFEGRYGISANTRY